MYVWKITWYIFFQVYTFWNKVVYKKIRIGIKSVLNLIENVGDICHAAATYTGHLFFVARTMHFFNRCCDNKEKLYH